MKQALASLLVFLIASPASASYSLSRSKNRIGGLTEKTANSRWVESRQPAKTRQLFVVCIYETAAVKPEDNNGNTLSETRSATFGGGTTTYSWDKDNRLRTVTTPTGVTTYQYDANGLRTRRVDSSGTVSYLLDGPSVLAELDGAGAVATRYLNNPLAVDDVFAHVGPSGTTWPLTDTLGSVYALTDSSGAIVRRYGFEVYGERTDLGGTGPTTDRGFTSRWIDANGTQDNRDRQRNPKLGGWLQPDRANLGAGNTYLYSSRPTIESDPTGMFVVCSDTASCTALTNFALFLILIGASESQQYQFANQLQVRTNLSFCEDDEEERQTRTWYRGLSADDVRELGLAGAASSWVASDHISSYSYRRVASLDFISTQIWDPGAVQAHLNDPENPPSPFVAATQSRSRAEFFATHGRKPGFYLATFLTGRWAATPGSRPQLFNFVMVGNRDQEGLFPGFIGAPFEKIVSIEKILQRN